MLTYFDVRCVLTYFDVLLISGVPAGAAQDRESIENIDNHDVITFFAIYVFIKMPMIMR